MLSLKIWSLKLFRLFTCCDRWHFLLSLDPTVLLNATALQGLYHLKKRTYCYFFLSHWMAGTYHPCKIVQHRRHQIGYPTQYLSRSLQCSRTSAVVNALFRCLKGIIAAAFATGVHWVTEDVNGGLSSTESERWQKGKLLVPSLDDPSLGDGKRKCGCCTNNGWFSLFTMKTWLSWSFSSSSSSRTALRTCLGFSFFTGSKEV